MIRRVGSVLLVAAVIGACNGEIRFEDPRDVPEGGVPPPPSPIEGGGDDAASDAPSDAPSKRCARDADCVLPSLRCDTVAGACVECTADAQCTTDEDRKRCDTALHRCVGCGSDGDCSGGKCQPDTHRCVTPCTSITMCITAEAPLCDTARGFCVRCTTAPGSTCTFTPDTPFCDQSGYCVGCLSDKDCSGGKPRCDPILGKCVQCASGADCAGTAQCDPSNGTCTG
ncbi:MAG TPA: hypothetical protein VIF62_33890 [Labilithrix sp.]